MPFKESLDHYFDPKGHAIAAIFTIAAGTGGNPDTTIETFVIFENPTADVSIFENQVEADSLHLMARTAQIAGVKRPNTVEIDGRTYIVERVSHDGTGVSTVYLRT